MARARSKNKAAADDPAAAGLDALVYEPVADGPTGGDPQPDGPVPEYTDPGWSDYVLRHFSPEELVEGRPTAAGCRRVAGLLLGDVLESRPRTVAAPTAKNGGRATVEWRLRLLWFQGGCSPHERVYGDVADVDPGDPLTGRPGNTDAEFARFAAATAATRAEVRTLRKALGLKVVAADEVTKVPAEAYDPEGTASTTQARWIDHVCRSNDWDVKKYLQLGAARYDRLDVVPFVVAKKMIAHLAGWQREPARVPESVKGYDPNWNEEP